MACASIQCKITNGINSNLICLYLSVYIQATRVDKIFKDYFYKNETRQDLTKLYNNRLIKNEYMINKINRYLAQLAS